MLSSARNAKNISLSEKIFHRIENNFSNDENYLISARILLANTYGLSGNQINGIKYSNEIKSVKYEKSYWLYLDCC